MILVSTFKSTSFSADVETADEVLDNMVSIEVLLSVHLNGGLVLKRLPP